MFLNAIIQSPHSPVSIFTKRGFVQLENFEVKDQFHVLFGADGPTETFPSTTQILPLAHALFRVSIENISPRLGTRSNLSAQDVIVVSMILAGKSFDLGDLILNTMVAAIEGKSTSGLPYGLLLTRIFEWFGVDFEGVESVSAKEFLDVKCLNQSNLKLEKYGTLSVVEVGPPSPPPVQPTSTVIGGVSLSEKLVLDFMDELRANHRQLVEDQNKLSEQLKDLAHDVKMWKELVFGFKHDTSPSKNTTGSGKSSFGIMDVFEFYRRQCAPGTFELRVSTGTDEVDSPGTGDKDLAIDGTDSDDASPRPRSALDALQEAAGTVLKDAAGNIRIVEAVAAAAKALATKDDADI